MKMGRKALVGPFLFDEAVLQLDQARTFDETPHN